MGDWSCRYFRCCLVEERGDEKEQEEKYVVKLHCNNVVYSQTWQTDLPLVT